MSTTLDEVMAELRNMRAEFGERMTSLETSVTGLESYVRETLTAEHRDTEHAERERAAALDALGALELERVADLENHERKARGTGGE